MENETGMSSKEKALQIWKTASGESLPEIFKAKPDSLAKIRRDITPEVAKWVTAFAIDELDAAINIGSPMTNEQIEYAADVIMKEFYFLSPDDLKLAFRFIKSAKYGPLYNRLDVNVICEKLNKYWQERCDAAIREHGRVSQEIHNSVADQITKQEFYRKGKEMQDSLKRDQENERAQKLKDYRDQIENEAQFDNFKKSYKPSYFINEKGERIENER